MMTRRVTRSVLLPWTVIKTVNSDNTKTMIALLLLKLAVILQIQAIIGDTHDNGSLPKILPVLPATRQNCYYDAFVASDPYNGKVFLFPWETTHQRGNWLKARGYCAANCAEMVTIHSEDENKFFLDFMRNVGYGSTGRDGDDVSIWLGAQVYNKTLNYWQNGGTVNYNPKASGEYAVDGLTCLTAAYRITNDYWYNYFCDWNNNFFACQRSAFWTITEQVIS